MEVSEANPQWATGFCDECWWSREALPTLSSWSEEGSPLRLLQRSVAKDAIPNPEGHHKLLRTLPAGTRRKDVAEVRGRKAGFFHNTTQFLLWSLEKLEAIGKKFLLLIWDNASWHISKEVRGWLGSHNRKVKESGRGVRVVSCLLFRRKVRGLTP
ncbi:MAG: hypothetical protein M3P70_10225 [Actinomycetota bacterium]|nr:hypothetical protein [Actinomycetota bacterium]